MKLTFIGTLHAGLTPHKELGQVLDTHNPDALLVEIQQSSIDDGRISDYPDEMQYALSWAEKHNVDYFGYDVAIDVLRAGKTEEDNLLAIEEQKDVLKRYTWKQANTETVSTLLHTPWVLALIDQQAFHRREIEMAHTIGQVLQGTDYQRVVVLTGTSHIAYFKTVFTDATFPFA